MIEIVKGELLHMAEEIPSDIRFHQNTKGVPPVADDVSEEGAEGKSCKHICGKVAFDSTEGQGDLPSDSSPPPTSHISVSIPLSLLIST